jgi:hypothetical protein
MASKRDFRYFPIVLPPVEFRIYDVTSTSPDRGSKRAREQENAIYVEDAKGERRKTERDAEEKLDKVNTSI